MKRNLTILFAIVFLFAFIRLSTTAETVEKDKGYISVNESITKEISPNQAEISIGIETSDKSLQVASENNKRIAGKVYSSLKSLLGTEDYIKTSNYSARPEYVYTRENKRVLDKYVVSNTVMIRTKKMELVSKLIDTAIDQGATNVQSLRFLAVDYDSSCNDTLAELTKKAYSKANSIAKSINSQITGVKSLNVTCSSEDNARPVYGMMMKNTMEAGSVTPIETGKIKIYANVDASFYVK